MPIQHLPRNARLIAVCLLASGFLVPLGPAPVLAQSIVTAVNGDPITTFDVDEHAKLLKVSRKPAGSKEALEDVVADRLKYDEARKWGVDASDADVQSALSKVAAGANLEPTAFVDAVQKAKIDPETIRSHLRALASWDAFVRSRNKTLGVSEDEVSAEIGKQGANSKITEYDLRQVVFVLPVNATPAVIDNRAKEAQALRARFVDCGTGLQLAAALPDVAVKERLKRTAEALNPALRKLLADTPNGHLTSPQRTASGLEMVAVCNRSLDTDQTTLRERVQNELLDGKLRTEAARMYQELRRTAVLSKG